MADTKARWIASTLKSRKSYSDLKPARKHHRPTTSDGDEIVRDPATMFSERIGSDGMDIP